MSVKPILYDNETLKLLDQRLLPTEEVWLEYRDYREVAEAISTMVVRGAPAIGVTAAFGAAFAARQIEADSFEEFLPPFEAACATLAATRPTAVNLFWALDRMLGCARANRELTIADLRERLLAEAIEIAAEDERHAVGERVGVEAGADAILVHSSPSGRLCPACSHDSIFARSSVVVTFRRCGSPSTTFTRPPAPSTSAAQSVAGSAPT